MSDYILEPLDTDPEVILQEFIDFIQGYYPNWKASEGQLDYLIAKFFSLKISMTADMAARVLRQIFLYFGSSVVGIQPIGSTPATGTATFEILDLDNNHRLVADTMLGIADTIGDIQLFSVLYDVDTLAGATSVQADIVAIEAGLAGSNLQGTVQLIEQADWLSNGTTDAPTSGGQNPEDIDTYMNRLTANLSLMAPRPVLGQDFALISQNVAGVWRAAAIDNYLPGPPPNTTAANAVAVAAIDQAGNGITGPLKTQLDTYLQSLRQQNFIVNILDPQYSVVDVTCDAYKNRQADIASASSQAKGALQDLTNPAQWGIPVYPPQTRGWENKNVMRYLELTTVVENCRDIDYVSNLTFSITSGGAQDKTDKNMPGAFPLPRPGNIIVNIH